MWKCQLSRSNGYRGEWCSRNVQTETALAQLSRYCFTLVSAILDYQVFKNELLHPTISPVCNMDGTETSVSSCKTFQSHHQWYESWWILSKIWFIGVLLNIPWLACIWVHIELVLCEFRSGPDRVSQRSCSVSGTGSP